MVTNYPLTPGSLASNCYPANPQSLYNEMFAQGFVQIDIQGVVLSATAPDPDDRDKLWIQLDGSSNPVRQWVFANGVWRWPHEVPASSNERRLWVGSESALETYDGGSAGTVSAITGPFWEVDHDFDAKMLLGAGTLPDTATTVNVNDEGGSETTSQVASHSHLMFYDENTNDGFLGNPSGSVSKAGQGTSNNENDYFLRTPGAQDTFAPTLGETADTGESAVSIMPPYRGVFLIKRTSRIFRTV